MFQDIQVIMGQDTVLGGFLRRLPDVFFDLIDVMVLKCFLWIHCLFRHFLTPVHLPHVRARKAQRAWY